MIAASEGHQNLHSRNAACICCFFYGFSLAVARKAHTIPLLDMLEPYLSGKENLALEQSGYHNDGNHYFEPIHSSTVRHSLFYPFCYAFSSWAAKTLHMLQIVLEMQCSPLTLHSIIWEPCWQLFVPMCPTFFAIFVAASRFGMTLFFLQFQLVKLGNVNVTFLDHTNLLGYDGQDFAQVKIHSIITF
jgi:hypothetical protein